MPRYYLLVGLAVAGSLTSGQAIAATATGVLTVQATVVDTCAVASNTLSFGVVDPSLGTSSRPSVNLNVTCTQGTVFAVGLGDGQNAASGQRRLRGSVSNRYIAYDLYQTSSGAQRFGDSVTAERISGQTGLGASANTVAVFGSIAPGQSAPSDTYSDIVPITVYY